MSLMSRSAYARRRGVDPALVTRWAKSGRIVVDGKLVDAEASDELLERTMDPARGGRGGKSDRIQAGTGPAAVPHGATGQTAAAVDRNVGRPPSPQTDTYTRVRTHREAFSAKTAEAVYRKMIGELVERAEYSRGLAQNLGPALQRLDTIAQRLGARLAAESDVRKCQNLLDEEISSIRTEIADFAQAMIDDDGGPRQ